MATKVNSQGLFASSLLFTEEPGALTPGFGEAPAGAPPTSSNRTPRPPEHNALQILIVEDNSDLRDIVARMVDALGHVVTVASTGKEALRQVHDSLPDIILLDIMMPEMDGFEFCQALQAGEQPHDCHIIITSARDALEDKVKGLELGAADYLTKPFNLAELKARLQVGERLARQRKLIRDQQARLEHLARVDTLTGLANRRHFDERLEEEWQRAVRYGHPLALLLCDIDHFKKINDTYGHTTGDTVLKHVAQTVLHDSRASDVIARYGGEEFVILLCETSLAQAATVAERLCAAVRTLSFSSLSGPAQVTMSIGVTELWEGRAESPPQLIAQADEALYAAKDRGRNRVECYKRKKS